jgi:hypothetical protein
LIAISSIVVWPIGFFRGDRIAGPPRMIAGASVLALLAILLLASCTAYLGASALLLLLKKNSDQSLVIITGAVYGIGVIVALVLCERMRPRGLTQMGLTTRQFFRAIPRLIVTALALLPLVYAASMLVEVVITLLHHQMPPAHPMLQELQEDRHSIWLWIVIFEAVALVPLAEELLFRGLLQTTLVYVIGRKRNPSAAARWMGVILTAALFALAHREAAFFLPLFVLAVGLGYLYERTANLWACVMMHGLFNGLQIIFYLTIVNK